MAEIQLLGLVHEATPTADIIDQLRKMGIPDEKITVISGIPYRADILGRPRPKRRVGLIALAGATLGLILGLFLSVVIFLLYPLHQGGQPVVPIPPTLIILFETTMLGTMWAAFFGLLGENRFPTFRKQIYDPRITEGHIGVVVEVDESLADQVEKVLRDNGAHHMRREIYTPQADYGLMAFWGTILGALALVGVITLLISYDVLKLPFPTNMANQESTAYLQGPRLAAPAQSIPIQGPVLIDSQPASEPVPTSADSIQRGQILFDLTCAVCHGQKGDGHSLMSSYFSPRPADLTGEEEQNLSDQDIFLVITQGRGVMPSLSENLSAQERWDVINYLRTLQQK
jgi:mono/diheme cytochrome c family protein